MLRTLGRTQCIGWHTRGTPTLTKSIARSDKSQTDSKPMVLSPVARVDGMNSAHGWHTMLVCEHGFAVERNAMFYFLQARFWPTSGLLSTCAAYRLGTDPNPSPVPSSKSQGRHSDTKKKSAEVPEPGIVHRHAQVSGSRTGSPAVCSALGTRQF
jgi:hypothetical protein